eukprot:CAMPEP_0179060380 /NCGR_PEP_ID=MMETSP0796-20121207/25837_1 /TAXON_ID=73915 /ORGANISM="Pyrodinium bahamense, Strain pbaha01" /LENGTH=58 /DNA_ID=CAMNT_0020757163 /DNA_START=71 /DNA_END=244 /DNA_ORIENTATION=+
MAAAKATTVCLALLAPAGGGAASANGQCRTLLGNVAAEGHSTLELAAYCRATLPPQFC